MVLKNMIVSIELFGIQRDVAKIEKVNMSITEETPLRSALEYIQKLFPDLVLEAGSRGK